MIFKGVIRWEINCELSTSESPSFPSGGVIFILFLFFTAARVGGSSDVCVRELKVSMASRHRGGGARLSVTDGRGT